MIKTTVSTTSCLMMACCHPKRGLAFNLLQILRPPWLSTAMVREHGKAGNDRWACLKPLVHTSKKPWLTFSQSGPGKQGKSCHWTLGERKGSVSFCEVRLKETAVCRAQFHFRMLTRKQEISTWHLTENASVSAQW